MMYVYNKERWVLILNFIHNIFIHGQFPMCDYLPWHRFQFNSQIDIKQWFLSEIRKMNIVLSKSMQTVKKKRERHYSKQLLLLMQCKIIKLPVL